MALTMTSIALDCMDMHLAQTTVNNILPVQLYEIKESQDEDTAQGESRAWQLLFYPTLRKAYIVQTDPSTEGDVSIVEAQTPDEAFAAVNLAEA